MTKNCGIFTSTLNNTILDSSLITPTKQLIKYNVKVVNCNDFIQCYLYSTTKKRYENDNSYNLKTLKMNSMIKNISFNSSIKNKTNILNLKIKPHLLKNINLYNINYLKSIEFKNIIRSKISCQLLAKCNLYSWKTFITLTYADNFTNIPLSRKHLQYFIDSIRRVKKDFMYICITEFQKRGAIHFHLLTNIDYNDSKLMYSQLDNSKYIHIKYWNYGFNSVEKITGDLQKIIGYISKYMTKDIDNRLFGKRRYTYSNNLIKPKYSYLNIDNSYYYNKFINSLKNYNSLSFQSSFIDKTNNLPVNFYEFYT